MENKSYNKEVYLLKRGELENNITMMQKGDKQARDNVITHYIYIIKNMVERNYTGDIEDLISHGIIGMLTAINIYHNDNDNHLTTMVMSYATKEIDRYLKINEEENLAKNFWYNDEANLVDDYDTKEKFETLRNAIDRLPYLDSMILKLHFGIGYQKCYHQNEIGNMFYLSKARINKILRRALIRLRNILELEPIKKTKKSNGVVPFYKIFEGYTTVQVNKVLSEIDEKKLKIIKYLYDVKYDISIKRWNELDIKSKIEFYEFVDEIRLELRKGNHKTKLKSFETV